MPGYEVNNWNGLAAPDGAPGAVIARLQHDIVAVLSEKPLAKRMIAARLEPIGETPQEFARHLAANAQKWAALVKSTQIRA